MTVPSTSIMFSKFKNNSIFLNNQSNMYISPYTKILHDPECQSNCCSENFTQPMQVDNLKDLNQYSTFISKSNESILTPNTRNTESQYLYYNVTTCNQVPEVQEKIGNESVMEYLDCSYEKPFKRARHESCSMNTNSNETQFKQKSYSKSIMKRKRKRTIFSTEQIIVMEGVFKKRPYVGKEERLFLSQRLNITEKAIKIWFQNRRRVTEKRERDQSDSYHSDSTIEEVCNDYNSRLDYIESRIMQSTDEYGFVTLDTETFTELLKIIDNVLSHSVDCNSFDDTNSNNSNNSYLMYEPVSPESLSDDNKESENISKWKPSKPEESLQRLIDIHTVLYRQ